GITVFAPDNTAFQAISSSLGSLSSNVTALTTVIGNHIINGTTVYSPSIFNGTVITSSQGENLTFTTNSSGAFVSSGQSTAQIVQTDILTENGVVHVINGVLLNTDSDQGAASSA
ncbi:FAS1 domain-containing protein, partial [Dendrothele bispora CBS 962.96]